MAAGIAGIERQQRADFGLLCGAAAVRELVFDDPKIAHDARQAVARGSDEVDAVVGFETLFVDRGVVLVMAARSSEPQDLWGLFFVLCPHRS